MAQSTKVRPTVQWVSTKYIVPNPLNPRKNDAIKTEEMQSIIQNKGWEIPLTVYQKGNIFVVLSGHRRLYAAKQANLSEIPVFVVDAPNNYQEEIERIASLQRGQVDWTPYEWGKFTYERWMAWGKPNNRQFSKKSGIPERTVAEYISVLQYFPREEIERGLEDKTFNMGILAALVDFMNKMKIKKTNVVADMSEEMIRKVILKKIELKIINRENLRRATAELFDVITNDDLMEFITTMEIPLQNLLNNYSIEDKPLKTFKGRLIAVGFSNRNIKEMNIPYNISELESMVRSLETIQETTRGKLKEAKRVLKEKEEQQIAKVRF
jgi:ParB/RepB/Spo0J family partition protein